MVPRNCVLVEASPCTPFAPAANAQAVQEQHVAVAAVDNTKELNNQLLVEVKLRMRHEKCESRSLNA